MTADRVTVRLAWGAVHVFAIDRKLADFVGEGAAKRFDVKPYPGRRVLVTASPADLRRLADEFSRYGHSGMFTPLARRTGRNLSLRIRSELSRAGARSYDP